MKKILFYIFIIISIVGLSAAGIRLYQYIKVIETEVMNLAGLVQCDTNKSTKIIAGVLRNTGSGWSLITTDNHTSVGITSVSNDNSKITVNFNFQAKNVISFVACPDEVMAKDKIFLGSSVLQDKADIYLYQNKSIQSYISFNGTIWVASGDEAMTAAFSNGQLTINHPEISGTEISASCRGGVYLVNPSFVSSNQSIIEFRDYTGALVTNSDINMKIFFSRTSNGNTISPNNYVNSNANIWIMGIMEID